mmetsp:Transcript_3548/g.2974  ORF Transcript_3548/g.2974 Transcript_3548/m.2974 type:complete len:251 (-) Transcript_3548:208-960(-)
MSLAFLCRFSFTSFFLLKSGEELVSSFWSALPATLSIAASRLSDNIATLNEALTSQQWEKDVTGAWRSLPRKLQLVQCLFVGMGILLALSAWCSVRSNKREKENKRKTAKKCKGKSEDPGRPDLAPNKKDEREQVAKGTVTPTTVASPQRHSNDSSRGRMTPPPKSYDQWGVFVYHDRDGYRRSRCVMMSGDDEFILRSKLRYHRHQKQRRIDGIKRNDSMGSSRQSQSSLNASNPLPASPLRPRAVSSF